MSHEKLEPMLPGPDADAMAMLVRKAAAFDWLTENQDVRIERLGSGKWFWYRPWDYGGIDAPRPNFDTHLEAVEAAMSANREGQQP